MPILLAKCCIVATALHIIFNEFKVESGDLLTLVLQDSEDSDKVTRRLYNSILLASLVIFPKWLSLTSRLIPPILPVIDERDLQQYSSHFSVSPLAKRAGVLEFTPQKWLFFMLKNHYRMLLSNYLPPLAIFFSLCFFEYFTRVDDDDFDEYLWNLSFSTSFSIGLDFLYFYLGQPEFPSLELFRHFTSTSARILSYGYVYHRRTYCVSLLFYQVIEFILVAIFYHERCALQILLALVFALEYLFIVQHKPWHVSVAIFAPSLLKIIPIQARDMHLTPWITYSDILSFEDKH